MLNENTLKNSIVNNLVSEFNIDTSDSIQMGHLNKAALAIARAVVDHIKNDMEITLNLPVIQLNAASITGVAGPYPVSISTGETLQTTINSNKFQVQ